MRLQTDVRIIPVLHCASNVLFTPLLLCARVMLVVILHQCHRDEQLSYKRTGGCVTMVPDGYGGIDGWWEVDHLREELPAWWEVKEYEGDARARG